MDECPACGGTVEWEDYFGPFVNGNVQHKGDIYRCQNEECETPWWHTFEGDTELREGYPC